MSATYAPSLLWLGGGVLAFMLRSNAPSVGLDHSQLALSIVALLFGIWVFWTHGGSQITAAGVYSLSSAVFIGFTGLWWWAEPGHVEYGIYVATLTGYSTNLLMYVGFWRRAPSFPVIRLSRHFKSSWAFQAGLLAVAVGYAAGLFKFGNVVQYTLGGMALCMVAAMLLSGDVEAATLRRMAIGLVVVLVFGQATFSGYGRLNLVALGMVAVLVVSAMSSRRFAKVTVLVGAAPVLYLLVRLRAESGSTPSGTPLDGLASIVNPMRDFGSIVLAHESGVYEFVHGESFLATMLFWVPRDLWPSKPSGFGSEIVGILYPTLSNSDHSVAAHVYGEWFYNWGWLGVAAMVPLVGLFVRVLDTLLSRSLHRGLHTSRNLLALVVLLLAVSDIPDLVWGGSFQYAARTGQRLLIVVPIALLFIALQGRSGREHITRISPASKTRGIATPNHRR